MIDNPAFSKLELYLPHDLLKRLTISAERMGVSVADLTEQALRRFLFKEQGGNAVFLSAPIIALVEGFYVENNVCNILLASIASKDSSKSICFFHNPNI